LALVNYFYYKSAVTNGIKKPSKNDILVEIFLVCKSLMVISFHFNHGRPQEFFQEGKVGEQGEGS
jgi:hypothetical protein